MTRQITRQGLYDATAARIAKAIVRTASKRVPVRFTFPDGSAWGPTEAGTPVFEIVEPEKFYRRLGRDLKMAFGEAYVAGEWRPGAGTDLADLLTPFAEKLADLVPAPVRKLRIFIDRRLPHHTANTRTGSKSNIEAHYDMSNELFSQFLDETMTYSSAWFHDFDEDFEAAQLRKIDGILDYAGVGPGSRVLEIGSGWGSLAIRAAERGATVTSITLSREQAELGSQRIKERRLDDLAQIQICDYRDVEGEYDAIVSIEMIEAVGEEFWPSYFTTIDQHLAPGGKVAIQAILMSHQRMLETRRLLRLDPEVHLPGRTDPVDPGDRGRLRGAHEPRDHRPARARSALRRDAAPLAYPVPRALGRDRADRLRRRLPPDLGVLPGLLRGRVRVALPRRLADPAGPRRGRPGRPLSRFRAAATVDAVLSSELRETSGVDRRVDRTFPATGGGGRLRFEHVGFGDDAIPYDEGWDLQRRLHEQRVADEIDDVVLLLEHPPVYTAGKRTEPGDRPVDGTPVVEVDRGGKITWHGPGQLVGYPITKLPSHVYVVDYVRRLEEALIRVCADLVCRPAGSKAAAASGSQPRTTVAPSARSLRSGSGSRAE